MLGFYVTFVAKKGFVECVDLMPEFSILKKTKTNHANAQKTPDLYL